MAFVPTVFFAVAHQGTTPRLIATQTNVRLTSVDEDFGAAMPPMTLTFTTSTITGSALNVCHAAFTLTWVSSTGSVRNCELRFNPTGFQGLSAAAKTALINAFVAGGRLVITVNPPGTNPNHTLAIELRCLKSSDFRINATTLRAIPAPYPGVVGSNLPAGAGTFTYQAASLGAGNLALVATDNFSVTAAAAPASTDNLTLTVTSTVNNVDDGEGVTSNIVGTTSVLPLDLHLPTETILLLDRSGSMSDILIGSANTKYAEVLKAANLFSRLHGSAVAQHSTPDATGAAFTSYEIAIGRFTAIGFFGGTFDASYVPADPPPFSVPNPAPVMPSEAANGSTPIGQALTDARARFTSGAWRRRHILLLTDGMDNAGTPSLVTLVGDYATHLPPPVGSPGADAANGVFVHVITYAATGDTPVTSLNAIATSHGGRYIGSETSTDPFDPVDLHEAFIDILGDVLPVEKANAAGTSVTVEDGQERAVFVALAGDSGAAMSATGPSAQATDPTLSGTTGATADDVTWATVNAPLGGPWTIANAPAATPLYGVFDLSLRMHCEVIAQGVARPIKLRATLLHKGVPVSGADVIVGVRRPGESIGQVITSFIQLGGLPKAILRGHASIDLIHREYGPLLSAQVAHSVLSPSRTGSASAVPAAVVAAGIPTKQADTKSLQRLLLEAAERARNLAFQGAGNSITLVEVGPGVYEGELGAPFTQEEGVYTFSFQGNGSTPQGFAFARNQRRSTVLTPTPAPEFSPAVLIDQIINDKVLWTATIFPHTNSRRPIGPGLGYLVAFDYADPKQRAKGPALVTVDNIDGTYSTRLTTNPGEPPPKLAFYFGPGTDRVDVDPGIQVTTKSSGVVRVKVTLDQLQILDDKDGCLTGKGELAFDAVVAPNGNPNRAVRTRVPEQGYLKAASGDSVEVNRVLYDGWVESGATLSVTLGGSEFDWLLFFERKEKLARYHRQIKIESGVQKFSPDDETNDAESLADWKLWYRVEVG